MLPAPKTSTVVTHWGTYRARMKDGAAVALDAYEGDPDPSPIANAMIGALTHPCRIARPSVRQSFLECGKDATGAGRGSEPFVEVDWSEAFDLVARELERVRTQHGNSAIYGGSYGWAQRRTLSSRTEPDPSFSELHRRLHQFVFELQPRRRRRDRAARHRRPPRPVHAPHAVEPDRRPCQADRDVRRDVA